MSKNSKTLRCDILINVTKTLKLCNNKLAQRYFLNPWAQAVSLNSFLVAQPQYFNISNIFLHRTIFRRLPPGQWFCVHSINARYIATIYFQSYIKTWLPKEVFIKKCGSGKAFRGQKWVMFLFWYKMVFIVPMAG